MFKRIGKILAWIEARITLYQFVAGSGVMSAAIITGWLASASAWIASSGPVGWWFAALIGALIATLIAVAVGWLRQLWITADAMRVWKTQVDSVNPLEPEFHKKIVRFQDVCHPITRRIRKKKFFDCELMGPANIVAVKNNKIYANSLNTCDMVVVKNAPNVMVYNAIGLEEVDIMGGAIWNCTFFVTQDVAAGFHKKGAKFVTLTGISEIDSDTKPFDPTIGHGNSVT
jgi:hypothetical protein